MFGTSTNLVKAIGNVRVHISLLWSRYRYTCTYLHYNFLKFLKMRFIGPVVSLLVKRMTLQIKKWILFKKNE